MRFMFFVQSDNSTPPTRALDAVKDDPAMRRYHLVPSVRGDLLCKLGRYREAQLEFDRAAALATNRRERELLVRRAAESARRAEISERDGCA